jgi:hypothetical protein
MYRDLALLFAAPRPLLPTAARALSGACLHVASRLNGVRLSRTPGAHHPLRRIDRAQSCGIERHARVSVFGR